ncbi:MAG TPA: PhnD/SsuA/transferrin family substrate-binding protein [Myxococcota bacterium]|nr:PhnD/SsuA/transferrin family substrate-binding protein [Myxococcota bacterium]HQK50033.1 PhnD/SsuA/transferrin family substrate-binding protein [Myxococcota bacterium]
MQVNWDIVGLAVSLGVFSLTQVFLFLKHRRVQRLFQEIENLQRTPQDRCAEVIGTAIAAYRLVRRLEERGFLRESDVDRIEAMLVKGLRKAAEGLCGQLTDSQRELVQRLLQDQHLTPSEVDLLEQAVWKQIALPAQQDLVMTRVEALERQVGVIARIMSHNLLYLSLLVISGCSALALLYLALQRGPDAPPAESVPTIHATLGIIEWQDRQKTLSFVQPVTARLSTYPGLKVGHRVFGASKSEADQAIAMLRRQEIQALILSPLRFVTLRRTLPLDPFMMLSTRGSRLYKAVICVRADSPYRSLADLKDEPIGFLPAESASGYQLPIVSFRTAHIDPEALHRVTLMNHGELRKALEEGRIAAGGTFADNCTSSPALRVLMETASIPNGVLVLAPDLPPEVRDALRDGFERLAGELERQEFSLYGDGPVGKDRIDGFTEFDAAAYERFEQVVGLALPQERLVIRWQAEGTVQSDLLPRFVSLLETHLLSSGRFRLETDVSETSSEAIGRFLVTLLPAGGTGATGVLVRVAGPLPGKELKMTTSARIPTDGTGLEEESARSAYEILRTFPIQGYLVPIDRTGQLGIACGSLAGVRPGMEARVDGRPSVRRIESDDIGEMTTRVPLPEGMSPEESRGRRVVLTYPPRPEPAEGNVP